MPARPLSMRKTREILRLRWSLGQSTRATARSCGVAASTVLETERRARASALSWPLPEDMDDAALEARLYPRPRGKSGRPMPDFATVHTELRRRAVTLELLWQEYRLEHPTDGYGYSRYCDLYRAWRGKLDQTMRQHHRAGERLFVDWAGMKMPIVDRATGEIRDASIFVASLGASSFIAARAFPDETSPSWLAGHIHAFETIGGVTEIVVPDNPRTAVTKPCRYEPEINPAYAEMAEYYGTVVIPARVRKPRDKAKVENAVLQVERWVLAPLRNHTFFSVAELNDAMAERLAVLNARELTGLDASRAELLATLDRPALRPLPPRRFETATWKTNVAVNIDYHIEFERHFYSVPSELIKKRVDVRATDTTVECLYRGRRVASHRRSRRVGGYTTLPEHMPSSHRRYAEWTPAKVQAWADSVGPETGAVAAHIMRTKPHPEQGFRSCLGLMRLRERYADARLEAACLRARRIGSPTRKSVQSILATGLDREQISEPVQLQLPVDHPNVRGAAYYN